MSLNVKLDQRQEGIYLLTIVGSIDSDTYKILEEKVTPLLNPKTKVIIFEMEGVEYVSSMGINVIIRVQQFLEKQNGMFAMTNLQPQVKKVFEIFKALPKMKVFESTEEMDTYLFKIQQDEIERGGKPPKE